MNAPTTEWTIPRSWEWSRMGEIASVIGGGTPRTDDPSNYEGGEIAWITPADLSGYTHKYIQRGARNITQRGLENSGARTMPAGTVLFSSRAPIGYVAIAANPVSTNQGFKSFVLTEDLSPDYIYYYLQRAKETARGLASGTTFLEISGAKATIIPVPVAPRPEQDRIVAEIEKQFTRLDDAVAALKRVQANLKRYRASVLKAACEGRLVPTEAELARKEGRSYEPASELLKRILAERRAKWEADQLQKMIAARKPPKDHEWKKKYKEPEAPEAADLPNLPEGWVWATLEQVSHLIRNGISTKPDQEKGLPILRISAVRPLSVDLDDVRFLTPSDEFREFKLCENDLLFTRYNGNREYVGVCGRVKRSPDGLVHPDKLIRVVPIRAGLSPWVEIVSNVGFPRAFLNKRIRTTAGQSGVSGEDLKQLPIPLCPESEAIRVATEVDRALTTIQAIKRSFEANGTRAAQVRNSILHKAFSGKLVPQDPNDEPASVLLERIRAERAALATNNGNQKATLKAGTANGQRRRRITRLAQGVSPGKG